MPRLLDALYLFAVGLLAPWLVWRAARTGRYRRDVAAKLLGRVAVPNPDRRPVAWFHGVSVGEVHLLVTLVAAFRKRHPDWVCVVSATTDTGLAEARNRFPDLPVISWPFDFSWAVAAALDAVRPDLVVLAEAELWPNFLAAAKARGVKVAVVNARLSPRSFRRYRLVAGLARRLLLGKVDVIAVQAAEYADRFGRLGVAADRLCLTGSVKYDGAAGDRDTPKGRELRRLLAWSPSPLGGEGLGVRGTPSRRPQPGPSPPAPLPQGERGERVIWVAGSTHAPEEEIVLAAFARLRERFPSLSLVLVPRHPDRFEEVARLIAAAGLPFVRRSHVREPLPELPRVVLLDTVGELGAAWGLADVGYVGGTLDGKRGGQSMIEPAGYGVPAVFGPHVWNFRDAARHLVEVGGAVMVNDGAGLERELAGLLADAARRSAMGAAARRFVRDQQGATQRTLDLLDELIGPAPGNRAAA
jgi:3-deoxy-D-manno-octulosonic-acid transferase